MLAGDGTAAGGLCSPAFGGWMGLGTGGRLEAGWAGEQVVCQAEHCVVKFFPSDSLGSRTGGAVPEGNARERYAKPAPGHPSRRWEWGLSLGENCAAGKSLGLVPGCTSFGTFRDLKNATSHERRLFAEWERPRTLCSVCKLQLALHQTDVPGRISAEFSKGAKFGCVAQ